jgi:hypothetical protein
MDAPGGEGKSSVRDHPPQLWRQPHDCHAVPDLSRRLPVQVRGLIDLMLPTLKEWHFGLDMGTIAKFLS